MKNFIKKLCPLFLGAVMLAGSTQSVPASEDNTEDPAEIYIGCDEYEPYNYLDENGYLAGIVSESESSEHISVSKQGSDRPGYDRVISSNDESMQGKQTADCPRIMMFNSA